tara:strand:+ start:1501 stop:1668 length:168 start_codon:yes stop_codon:yes gene_type:complete
MIIFSELVMSYYNIGDYDILIIQDKYGELITIKIDKYGESRSKATEYVPDGEILH